jgi:hypothetical protein
LRHRSKLVLLLSLLFAGSMWFYVRYILVAQQVADSARDDRPRGILSDLYPRWLGAREVLLHGRNPYSPEVTRDIQVGYYGRVLDPARANDPKDQQGFAYPVYVVFLLAPTIHLPFSGIEPVFRWLLVVLLAISLWGWLRFVGWQPDWATTIALLALTLGNFPVVQAILLEQLTVVVAALVMTSLLCLCKGDFLTAGILLAVATIKPQLVLALVLWLLLWACSDWHVRKRFVIGFLATAAVLELASELVLPGWIGEFRHALVAYRQYTGALSIFSRLTGPVVGTVINASILLGLAWFSWGMRKVAVVSREFILATSMVLAATVVTLPSTALYNQVLLLPAVLLLLKNWKPIWERNPLNRLASVLAAAAVLWPWIAAVSLVISYPFVSAAAIQQGWARPLFSSLAIPPLLLVLYGLYLRQAVKTAA